MDTTITVSVLPGLQIYPYFMDFWTYQNAMDGFSSTVLLYGFSLIGINVMPIHQLSCTPRFTI